VTKNAGEIIPVIVPQVAIAAYQFVLQSFSDILQLLSHFEVHVPFSQISVFLFLLKALFLSFDEPIDLKSTTVFKHMNQQYEHQTYSTLT
jgi:hypothetical protein